MTGYFSAAGTTIGYGCRSFVTLASSGTVSCGSVTQWPAVEISVVRNRLNRTIELARERARQRRQRVAAAEQAYYTFLEDVATPVTRLLANSLKVENLPFTVFTPSGGLRLAFDRGRDDYVEFALDASVDPPQVIGRIRRARGSRTLDEERPVKPGAADDGVSEDDVLTFLLDALQPWFER